MPGARALLRTSSLPHFPVPADSGETARGASATAWKSSASAHLQPREQDMAHDRFRVSGRQTREPHHCRVAADPRDHIRRAPGKQYSEDLEMCLIVLRSWPHGPPSGFHAAASLARSWRRALKLLSIHDLAARALQWLSAGAPPLRRMRCANHRQEPVRRARPTPVARTERSSFTRSRLSPISISHQVPGNGASPCEYGRVWSIAGCEPSLSGVSALVIFDA